jgi:hypothetical protein
VEQRAASDLPVEVESDVTQNDMKRNESQS